MIRRPSCFNEPQYQAIIPLSPTLSLLHIDYIQIHSLCLPETMASSAWHEADTQHLLNVGIGSQPCSSPPPPAAISYALKICWKIIPGCQLPESCLTYFHNLLFHSRNLVIPSNIYLEKLDPKNQQSDLNLLFLCFSHSPQTRSKPSTFFFSPVLHVFPHYPVISYFT